MRVMVYNGKKNMCIMVCHCVKHVYNSVKYYNGVKKRKMQ